MAKLPKPPEDDPPFEMMGNHITHGKSPGFLIVGGCPSQTYHSVPAFKRERWLEETASVLMKLHFGQAPENLGEWKYKARWVIREMAHAKPARFGLASRTEMGMRDKDSYWHRYMAVYPLQSTSLLWGTELWIWFRLKDPWR